MRFKRWLACWIGATTLLLAHGPTTASEFWTYVPGSGSVKNNNPGGGAGFAAVRVTGYTGSGGQYNGYFWSGGPMPADAFFRFFCIDLGQNANGGPNPYAASGLNDDEIRKLYDIAYPNKTAGDFWDNGALTSFGVFADATSAAAFQVALWNLYFDNDLTLAGGAFQWTGAASGVSNAAQALLDQVAGYGGDGYQRWTLYRFVSPVPGLTVANGYQDYVSATYRVTEPATFGLAAIALAWLALVIRRRRV